MQKSGKYRIRKEITKTGTNYMPQIRFLWFWFDMVKKDFDNQKEAEKAIAFYEMMKHKRNVSFIEMNTVPHYEPVNKEITTMVDTSIDLLISKLSGKIEERENHPTNPMSCGHYKTAISVLQELKEERKNEFLGRT